MCARRRERKRERREREKEREEKRQAIEERKRERRKLYSNTKMVCNPRTRRSEIETEKG